jgi:hypothetical protein
MTVAQLLQNATAREINEWAAFFALEQHEREEATGKKPKKLPPKAAAATMRGWFGHRVQKKKGA